MNVDGDGTMPDDDAANDGCVQEGPEDGATGTGDITGVISGVFVGKVRN